MRKVWETKITHPDSLKLLAFKLQTLEKKFLIIPFFKNQEVAHKRSILAMKQGTHKKIIKIVSLYEISQIIMYNKKILEGYRDDELYSHILK